MHDLIGENITAYTFELTSGYIVVSARFDVPNLIMEWADEAEPFFALFDDIADDDTIVYLGLLNYFVLDEDNETVTDVFGETFCAEEIESPFEELLDTSHIAPEILEEIVAEYNERSAAADNASRAANVPGNGHFIYCPFEHSSRFFRTNPNQPSTWTSILWRNDFSTNTIHHVPYLRQVNMHSGTNNCIPTAMANLIVMIGRRENNTNITRYGTHNIYNRIENWARNHGWTPSGGMPRNNSWPLFEDVLRYFRVSFRSVQRITPTPENIIAQLNRGLPFELILIRHETYGATFWMGHSVAAYAFTRLRRDQDGAIKTYVRIADGWVARGRFIDMATINNSDWAQMLSWSR